jgi:hypothetical protein
VVAVQATDYALRLAADNFKLEDNGERPPLIIFYQWALQAIAFDVLCLVLVACWLKRFLQAEHAKQKMKVKYNQYKFHYSGE